MKENDTVCKNDWKFLYITLEKIFLYKDVDFSF